MPGRSYKVLDRNMEVVIAGSGGRRSGAGRPPKSVSEKGVTVSAYLSADDAAYLAKWSSSNSVALRDLIDRARKFWPDGA